MRLSLPNLKTSYCTDLLLRGEILLSDKMISEIKKQPLILSYRYSRDQSSHELSMYARRLRRKKGNELLIECRPVASPGKRHKFMLKDVQSFIKNIQKIQKGPINFTAFLYFECPRAEVTTPLPIKLASSENTELELCGIRIRSSGSLQSLIIDTFPKKMVDIHVIIGISRKLSLDLINDVLERSKKIISRFLEVRQ